MAGATLALRADQGHLAGMGEALDALAAGVRGLTSLERFCGRFPQVFEPDRDKAGYTLIEDAAASLVDVRVSAFMRDGHFVAEVRPTALFQAIASALADDLHVGIVEVHGWPVINFNAGEAA